jgi:hypothetical protein
MRDKSQLAYKSLVLWMNSTLGVLIMLGHREETEGAWIHFKKPILENLPILDISSLPKSSLQLLAEAYDNIKNRGLLSFPQIDTDGVRAMIDQAVSRSLGLPDLSVLRSMLVAEPLLSQSIDSLLQADPQSGRDATSP